MVIGTTLMGQLFSLITIIIEHFGQTAVQMKSEMVLNFINTSTAHNVSTYTSTLQFPKLSQRLHTGMYACRIGAGILANSIMVSANGMIINFRFINSCLKQFHFFIVSMQFHP